eukprot:TRINITY_DN91336_c0_g1_i1.p1 TRINITY_DN91336_c0_g1~~TRINITY_DN91336_c0_g1_i1.p1  ORF type:complete len:492 (-),score=80.38 TRINITY_DN91336_c0_g1_i1:8-1294(-)
MIGSLVTALLWFLTCWKERARRCSAKLAAETPQARLADVRRALRVTGSGQPRASPTPQQVSSELGGSGHCSVLVRNMAGVTVFGPTALDSSTLVEELALQVGKSLGQPTWAVTLLAGSQALDRKLSLAAAGVIDRSELQVVISRDRCEIADALYARAVGQLWVGDGRLITTPFSTRQVVFYEAKTIRLYDEWVTTWQKQKVKSGRAPGSHGQNDPGSDSEYEEIEHSEWVAREQLQHSQHGIAHKIYLDDGSGQQALLSPDDRLSWARENTTLTYSNTEAPRLAAGLALQAMVGYERERGTRREEHCIEDGETVEVVAEASLTEEGLVLQEPQRPWEELHRIDSVELLQGTGRPSALANKTFLGAVLRGPRSLEQMILGSAKWWRVGKWLSGLLLGFLLLYTRRRFRQLRAARAAVLPSQGPGLQAVS